jgi:hypothetical protein
MATRKRVTGGCLCDAIRYEASVSPADAHYCHCRMCQRAFGNAFATFVSFPLDRFRWIRGRPKMYQSSKIARRGFCARCGTPLVFRNVLSRQPNRNFDWQPGPSRAGLARDSLGSRVDGAVVEDRRPPATQTHDGGSVCRRRLGACEKVRANPQAQRCLGARCLYGTPGLRILRDIRRRLPEPLRSDATRCGSLDSNRRSGGNQARS